MDGQVDLSTDSPARDNAGAKGRLSRRRLLGRARAAAGAAAVFSIVPRHVLGGPGKVAPSEKTTLAGIGLGGQGTQNIRRFLQFAEVQVVAVCDVDREAGGFLSWNWGRCAGPGSSVPAQYPNARRILTQPGAPRVVVQRLFAWADPEQNRWLDSDQSYGDLWPQGS